MVAVVASGYRCACEIAKRACKYAPGTKRFRRVGKDFSAAFPANSDHSDHRRVLRTRSILYSVKFFHLLLPHYSNEMAQLVFDVARCRNGVSNFLSQQPLVTLPKS